MSFKKGSAELLSVIICIVLIGSFVLIIMGKQTKNAENLNSTVQEENWLLSGKD